VKSIGVWDFVVAMAYVKFLRHTDCQLANVISVGRASIVLSNRMRVKVIALMEEDVENLCMDHHFVNVHLLIEVSDVKTASEIMVPS
jgi:hypothetical protein